MKNILVIGSSGQIGSELTRVLRARYGGSHVVAGYIVGAEPKGELLEGGQGIVHEDVFESVAIILKYILVLLEKFDGQKQKIVSIQTIYSRY